MTDCVVPDLFVSPPAGNGPGSGGGGGGGDASAANQTTIIGHVDEIEGLLSDATITRTAIASGAIASAETLHGFHLFNSHATDAVLVYIRFGNGAASVEFVPVAIAAGESVNVFYGQKNSDGEPVGANGVFVTDESTGAATIADLTGHIVTGAP